MQIFIQIYLDLGFYFLFFLHLYFVECIARQERKDDVQQTIHKYISFILKILAISPKCRLYSKCGWLYIFPMQGNTFVDSDLTSEFVFIDFYHKYVTHIGHGYSCNVLKTQ